MRISTSTLLISIGLFAATAAFAKPVCQDPNVPPGQAKKTDKITILHCGCPDEGDTMYYREIQVSGNSKGHAKHEIGSIDSCSDGADNYRDFVRTASDCQVVEDDSELLKGWASCGTRMAMDACGTVGGDG